MDISQKGLDLIKEFEGLRLKPYRDVAGVPTIGWGSTYYRDNKKVTMNDNPITEDEANSLLAYIANKDFGSFINKVVKVELNQNQFDALVSFAYNLGNGNLQNSTLLKKINSGDFIGASNEFIKWNKVGKTELAGLTKRREKEKKLFLS